MKTIHKIAQCSFQTAALLAVALCVQQPAQAADTDQFRINMQYSYSPQSPGNIPPVSPTGYWADVADWQQFLKTHGEISYMGGAYPNNNFDMATEMATRDWQSRNGLTPDGIVHQATFNKAVLAGMHKYNTTITLVLDVMKKEKAAAAGPKDSVGDLFRIPMGVPYNPNGPESLPPSPPNSLWADVTDWQVFLQNWEGAHQNDTNPPNQYMDSSYPSGTFDNNTKLATSDFQKAAKAAGINLSLDPKCFGIVDQDTYKAATTKTAGNNSFNTTPMAAQTPYTQYSPPPDLPKNCKLDTSAAAPAK